MSYLLDYAEQAGLENIKFRLQNAENLAREANATLTVLLTGMAAAMAYAIKGFEQITPTPLAVGASILSIWLMIAAIILVVFCILTTEISPPTNDPMNLYLKEHELNSIREVELRNLSKRISDITVRNHRVAAWLDRVRLLAIGSPIIYSISVMAWAAH